jgi:hypothetical protein
VGKGMTDDADRAAYVRALVAHRCPELDQKDLAALTPADNAPTGAIAQPAEMLPVEIGDAIIDAITALEDKLDWLAEAVGANKDEDDDAARRRAG